MKKRFLAALCALAICAVSTEGAAEGSTGIFYRVTGGKNEMVLLGSIHIGNEAMYPLGTHITDALDAADVLVFECDTDSEEALVAAMTASTYPMGERLSDHISEECYEWLSRASEKLGYPVSAFQAFKPWAVMNTFALKTTAVEMGVDDLQTVMSLGVEKQVQALAGDKQEAWLETAQEQYDIMDGFSQELQEYLLQTACVVFLDPDEASGMDADMAKWPDWWRDGNAEAFATSYLEGMAAEPRPELMAEYHQRLVTERNRRMALGLREMLEGEEHSYFVTVGLLHLVLPDDSVISELKRMGYTVEPIIPV